MYPSFRFRPLCTLTTLLLGACAGFPGPEAPPPDVAHAARRERVEDFARLVPPSRSPRDPGTVLGGLERVTTAVPWPRGLVFVEGQLVALARGRHRNAGGVDHAIADFTGSLFTVDTATVEPVLPGRHAGEVVLQNARLLAEATGAPFRLPDRAKDPTDDVLMDRPYCTLAYDPVSRNLFLCGYSGVDLPERRFRKNATDSILRFDLRTRSWHVVEQHDPDVVPVDELGYVVSNEYYPHHDAAENAAPHGWVNGPDGCTVVGDFLYAAAKDNHLVVQYDLGSIRRDPAAGCPESRPVLGPRVTVRYPGGEREMELLGPSAIAQWGGHLYVGYRTSSVVLRFALDPTGDLVPSAVGDLVAVFQPWDPEVGKSANLLDLAFNPRGELFVSCATRGRVWNVGVPDPALPFFGDDSSDRPLSAPPALDLSAHTGKPTRAGNIVFDERGRLYVCSGNYDADSEVRAGVIYRASPVTQ